MAPRAGGRLARVPRPDTHRRGRRASCPDFTGSTERREERREGARLRLAHFELRHVPGRLLRRGVAEPPREGRFRVPRAHAAQIRGDRRPGHADGVAPVAAFLGEERLAAPHERLATLSVGPTRAKLERRQQQSDKGDRHDHESTHCDWARRRIARRAPRVRDQHGLRRASRSPL